MAHESCFIIGFSKKSLDTLNNIAKHPCLQHLKIEAVLGGMLAKLGRVVF